MAQITPNNLAFSASGKFVSGGSVTFGFEGVPGDPDVPASLKGVFIDLDRNTPALNPQPLDSDAKYEQSATGIIFGEGIYSVLVRDNRGVQVAYNPSYNPVTGDAASFNVGTGPNELPRNSDLSSGAFTTVGTSATIDTGTAFDQIPFNTDIVYPVANVTALRALTGITVGQSFYLEGHTNLGIGSGTLLATKTQESEVDNNGTLFIVNGIVLERPKGIITPDDFGILYDDESSAAQNSIALQHLINEGVNGYSYVFDRERRILTMEEIVLPIDFRIIENLSIRNINPTATNALVGAATKLPPGQSNYDSDARIYNSTIWSNNGHAIFMRARQADFNDCTLVSPNGRGISLSGDALSTGNKVRNSYFAGCMWGIYAEEGLNKPTDMHIIDNRFWQGSGVTESSVVAHILLEGSSGTRLDGNHYFGDVSDHFVRIGSGGSSFRMSNEYFERNVTGNRAIYIAGGNGATYSFSNLSFWCAGGNTNPLITINRNAECEMSFDSCKFYDCSNRQLFDIQGSPTSQMRIKWGDTNSFTGSISVDSFSDQFIFYDYNFNSKTLTDRFETVAFGDDSQYIYTNSAFGTGTLTLAILSSTINGSCFRVLNGQGVLTMTIALSSTAIGLGYTIVGKSSLLPNESAIITIDRENTTAFVF